MLKDTRPGIAVVTRKTRMAGMLERWATKGAARFRLVQAKLIERARAGDDFDQDDALAEAEEEFDELAEEEDVYQQVVKRLHSELDFGLPVQFVDRGFLPNFDFGRFEAVVVVGQDGLVANAAKYVGDVPIVAVNPDPARIDGILLPFQTAQARAAVSSVLKGTARTRSVTLAEAHLQDGQKLLAFNDFFIGCNSHVSARYRLAVGGRESSGVLVATGAGSTGWLSSVFNMAGGIAKWLGVAPKPKPVLQWEDRSLVWAVREPFVSRASQAELVIGKIDEGEDIVVESMMPANGVIFSDGVESDFLEFNGGTIARIGVSQQSAHLVVP
jgi:hypothetical protein